VKIFRKMACSSRKSLAKMRNEFEVLKGVDHPNIIRIFEYFEDEKKLYIIMEKCEGGELYSQLLKLNSFNENQAANILRQLLSAVVYLHERSIVHRDIKPENILLQFKDDMETIKLIDFGVAEYLSASNTLQEPVGTVFYIAPEVLSMNYNEKCDLWSCGVIAYMLMCGSPPFHGKTDVEIVASVKKGEVSFSDPVWQTHSAEVKDFILRLLCPAEQRMSATAALQHAWLARESAQQRPPPSAPVLASLRHFHCGSKLKEAVRTYITSQCLTIHDTKELSELFKSIDTNRDGKLSKEEMTQFFISTMGAEFCEEDVERIMKEIDTDRSGFVDYSEFVKAAVSESVANNEKYLKMAFNKFDIDQSGKISAEELKRVLGEGKEYDDAIWREIIRQADLNNDGEIDFNEFAKIIIGT
jgi:calcium-dependent protein kinase